MSRKLTPGFRRLPRVADRMTAAHVDLVAQSLAAERSGDAARALELHASVPALNLRSRHNLLLDQLASLGDDLPDWVWARWIAYQAIRCEDPDTETGTMQRLALTYVLETFHDDQLADCHANGGDPIKVVAWVASESWLFQQLLVHEFGGLERFVGELATGGLADHAALARSWAGVPLGGYLVGPTLPGGRLRVEDLAADSWTEVLDLGARSNAGDSGWVLGRLVPSGVDDLLMFDTPPIAVPERVARDVAEAPKPWAVVAEALDEGRLVERHFMRADHELVTDVPSIDLLRVGTPPADLERVTAQLRAGRDEIPRAAFRILRRAADGAVPDADAPHVAAAVLQPAARADARRLLVREGQYDVWTRWAALVHEPARWAAPRLRRGGAGGRMTSAQSAIVLRSATFGGVRSISQRELRNDNAEIIRAVEAGESFTVTRRGVPVARLTPVPASDLRRVRPAAPDWDIASLPRVAVSQPMTEHLEDLRGDR